MILLIKQWTKHGSIPTVTKKTLALGAGDATTGWYAKTYSNTSISMFIIPRALQFTVLKHGLFVEHDAVGFTKSALKEGDIIEDDAGNEYLALAVRDHNILSQFMFNQVDLKKLPQAATTGIWDKWTEAFRKFMHTVEKNAAASGSINLYALVFGAQDPATGWYACEYNAPVAIEAVILNARAQTGFYRPGMHSRYNYFGYTLDDVNQNDVVEDAANVKYRVQSVKPVSVGSRLVFFELELERLNQWTTSNLFAVQLDIRVFSMGANQSSYIEGALVSIYLGGVLVQTGLTDSLGTFKTVLVAGTYDIIITKDGYSPVTKHETLTIQTELMVNLPYVGGTIITEPIPINPVSPPNPLNPNRVGFTYTECVTGVFGKAYLETITKAETVSIVAGNVDSDTITKTESVVITNV